MRPMLLTVTLKASMLSVQHRAKILQSSLSPLCPACVCVCMCMCVYGCVLKIVNGLVCVCLSVCVSRYRFTLSGDKNERERLREHSLTHTHTHTLSLSLTNVHACSMRACVGRRAAAGPVRAGHSVRDHCGRCAVVGGSIIAGRVERGVGN